MKTLIIVYSYHHFNTLKIAQAFSSVLDATIVTPDQITSIDLFDYNLIGFGSGIDSAKHYPQLLDLARNLKEQSDKPSFIFSTSAIQGQRKVTRDHLTLKKILIDKGYCIIDEFSCIGYNTNSFLKYLGGMNKGRPNEQDILLAKDFAKKLISKI